MELIPRSRTYFASMWGSLKVDPITGFVFIVLIRIRNLAIYVVYSYNIYILKWTYQVASIKVAIALV